LQLHRQFFTRALSGPEEAFNRRHKYAPSVVAVFLSATRMIANVEELYTQEPDLTARILGYWSNAFSAAVSHWCFCGRPGERLRLLFPPALVWRGLDSFQAGACLHTPSYLYLNL
jgi:hypothetical protein